MNPGLFNSWMSGNGTNTIKTNEVKSQKFSIESTELLIFSAYGERKLRVLENGNVFTKEKWNDEKKKRGKTEIIYLVLNWFLCPTFPFASSQYANECLNVVEREVNCKNRNCATNGDENLSRVFRLDNSLCLEGNEIIAMRIVTLIL